MPSTSLRASARATTIRLRDRGHAVSTVPAKKRRARVDVVIVGAVMATLASTIAATLSGAPPAEAAPRNPEVGQCFTYGRFATVDAAKARAVACKRPHVAEAFYVGALPDSLGPPRKASFAARAKAAAKCTEKALHQAIGLGDRQIPSRFEVVVVFPTNQQWADGARWLRCDAALVTGSRFTKISKDMRTLTAAAERDAFDHCTPSVPGSKAKVAHRCTAPKKNWVLVQEPTLASADTAFPGLDAMAKKAKAMCKKVGVSYAKQASDARWWAIWPKKAGWKAGYRTAMCFVPYADYYAK